MRNNHIAKGTLCVLLLITLHAKAEIILPKILGNNMVLQRNQPVPIWGFAAPGERVSVNFNNQSKTTKADASGNWKVILNAMPASAMPQTMTITGSNTITLDSILVGEVWLCSGQSNMEYTMRKNSKVVKTDSTKESPVDELLRAHNSAIRIFLVTRKNLKPDSTHSGWSIAQGRDLRSFSAAGYFFAKELYAQLGVPIGVISAAVPGSAIEPWLSGTITNEKELTTKQPVLKIDESAPGKFYPIMIQPLAPFAIKGFLWYQGETNCFQNESIEYTYKMQALIDGWRKLWQDEKLPFYYVQIAPYYYSKSAGKYPLTKETLPKFWEAQTLALHIPHTGMVVITDLINSPEDLHPGFKWEVGRRLALVALAKTYGKNVVYSGPQYEDMKVKRHKAVLSFTHTGSGLISKDDKPLSEFEIAGANGKFVPAKAVIKGDKVIVSAPAVAHPVAVRFEWDEGGKANLFNKEGLPAVPFRTDNPYQYKGADIVSVGKVANH